MKLTSLLTSLKEVRPQSKPLSVNMVRQTDRHRGTAYQRSKHPHSQFKVGKPHCMGQTAGGSDWSTVKIQGDPVLVGDFWSSYEGLTMSICEKSPRASSLGRLKGATVKRTSALYTSNEVGLQEEKLIYQMVTRWG